MPPASSTVIGGRTLGSGGRTYRSTRHLKNTCPPSKGRASISARMGLPGKRKVPRRSPPDLHPETGVWRGQSVAQVRAAPGLSGNRKERAAPGAGSQIGAGGCPPCVSGRRPATLAAAFLVRWRRKEGRSGSAQGASLRQPVRLPSRHPGSVCHTLRHRRKPLRGAWLRPCLFPAAPRPGGCHRGGQAGRRRNRASPHHRPGRGRYPRHYRRPEGLMPPRSAGAGRPLLRMSPE